MFNKLIVFSMCGLLRVNHRYRFILAKFIEIKCPLRAIQRGIMPVSVFSE